MEWRSTKLCGGKNLIHWLGAMLIITACAGVGWREQRELHHRVRSLQEGETIAELLRMVVCVRGLPLPFVLGEMQSALPQRFGAAERMYAQLTEVSFCEYWKACLGAGGLCLTSQSILTEAVKSITCGQPPERAMDICQARLRQSLKEAQKQKNEKARLYVAFGTAAGCLLTLILL